MSQMIPSPVETQHWLINALSQLNDVVLVTEGEPINLPGPRIVYVNATFERMTGYSKSDVIGQTPRMLQGPRTSRAELARLRLAMEAWESCRVCVTNYRKDGTPFDVEFEVVPFANEDGWYTHWVALQRDVTERTLCTELVNAAHTVDELVQRCAAELAEYTGAAGCMVSTRNGFDEAWNTQHVRFKDGRLVEDDIKPPRKVSTAVEHATAVRADEQYQLLMLDTDGTTIRGVRQLGNNGCEIVMCLWRAAAGPWELANQLTPVVASRVLAKYESLVTQRERERLARELEHARKLEAVGRMAGGVAHDFNNMLTVIIGNLEFLRQRLDATLSDEPVELGEILRAADQARGLVGQLLAISHRIPLTREAVDVGALLQATVTLLRRTIGAEIAVHLEVADEPLLVDGDATLLQQAVLNLALNARDAIESVGGPAQSRVAGTISIVARTVVLTESDARRWTPLLAGPCIELTVSDTGPGMTDDVLTKAFEPFFTTKDVGAGTGLGLSSVLGSVTSLGGMIQLEPAAPHGVTARLRFPRGTLHVVAASDERRPVAPTVPRTLLVVDDEAGVRKICLRILRSAGHHVYEAEQGADALRMLATLGAKLDGVVTDVRMPIMGGIALAREIRRTHPSLPIVFMSGDAEPNLLDEFSANALMLSKPFTGSGLLRALSALEL